MTYQPLVTWSARRRATTAAMGKGMGRFEARRKLEALSEDQVSEVIQTGCINFGVVPPAGAAAGVGAIGDGEIIRKIDEFCKAHPEVVEAITKGLLILIGL